jgi:single-stranded-DNA-specific exonuclease
VNSVNLVKVLDQCADLVVAYGGHNQAAGMTIREENVDAFRERFSAACKGLIDEEDFGLTHNVDAWISLGDADQALIESVDALRPLGLGNPTPIWGV